MNSELVDSFFYDIPVNENPIDIGSVGDIFPVEEFTREVYSPDWSNYSELAFSGLRDYDYINKRYFSYPFHKYEIFVSGSADKPLLLVYRKIKTSLGFLVGRIVEALIPSDCSQKDFDNFLIKTIRYFHGCAYIDFYCTSKKYIDLFRVSGFVLDENGSLPSLLDPVDLGRKYQNFEIWVSPNIRKQYPDIENDFFLSRGDGDQDRPNQSYWNEVNNL